MSRAVSVALMIAGLACAATPSRPPPPQTPVLVEKAPPAVDAPDEPEATQGIDPVRPASSYLSADAAVPTRFARVAFYEAFYAIEPGDGVPQLASGERTEAQSEHVVPVVEERAQSVRVVLDEDEVRLVVYLRHGDLHPVVRKRARAVLGERGELPGGDTGVWLRPGLVASGTGMLRTADITDPIFTGTAWVHRSAVDRVYEPEAKHQNERVAYLAAGTKITTKAGALLLTTAREVVVDAPQSSGPRTRVRYVSESLWIEGWVPTPAIQAEPSDPGEAYGTIGFGSGWGGSHVIYLHAGDLLRIAPNGEVIGLVTGERIRAFGGEFDPAGRSVSVRAGPWSFVPLWVSLEDLAHGAKWESIYHARVRIEPLPGAPDLPVDLIIQHDDVSDCLTAALVAGVVQPLDLRLEWKSGNQVPIPPSPKLDPALRACLEKAFHLGHVSASPALPLHFTLHLDPTPLPPH